MKIKRIKIENFRVIQNLEIECGSNLNVFVGVNGAGKTTVIAVLVTLLSWLTSRLKSNTSRGIVLTDNDITIGKDYCRIEIELFDNIKWSLYKRKRSKQSNDKSDLSEMNKYVEKVVCNDNYNKDYSDLPAIAYYGVNRSVTDIPTRLYFNHDMPINCYDDFKSSIVHFRRFFEWFREREDIENEDYRISGYSDDNQLTAIRAAINTVMPNYSEFRIRRNPRAVLIKKNSIEYKMNDLSDGEKCYFTLTADIARRLAMTHPMSKNPLLEEGVFLIDEIDLHLHPNWQMEVLSGYMKTFPNCQFFITTHSPHVVSNINTCNTEKDKLFLFENGMLLQSSFRPYGRTAQDVLLRSFDLSFLRAQEVQEHIDAIWYHLSERDYSSDAFLQEMNWLFSHLDKEDPEYVKIKLEIAKINKLHSS